MSSDLTRNADQIDALSWAVSWRYYIATVGIAAAIGAAEAFLLDGIVAVVQRLTIGHSTPFDQPLWAAIGFNLLAGLVISFLMLRVLMRWAIGHKFAGATLTFEPTAGSKERAS